MTSASAKPPTDCSACGAPGTGRFCAECGAALRDATCSACATALIAGASFCHRCGHGVRAAGRAQPAAAGAAAGASAATSDLRSHKLSWAVGTIAFVALAAFVVTQRSVESGVADGQAAASSAAPLSADAGRPPDISTLTPRERAERLYDRAMMAKEAGKLDSATFFATMATMAYGQLEELNLDDRYDLGRVALLAGSLPLASAEADTILSKHPTHLLGLMLAEDAARALGDEPKAKAAHATLVANGAKERLSTLPEYALHATEIAAALKKAGVAGGSAPTP